MSDEFLYTYEGPTLPLTVIVLIREESPLLYEGEMCFDGHGIFFKKSPITQHDSPEDFADSVSEEFARRLSYVIRNAR